MAEIFQWNEDLQGISHYFRETDLKSIFQEHSGTPVVLEFSPYGSLIKCILG